MGVRTNLLLVIEDAPWSEAPSNLKYNNLILITRFLTTSMLIPPGKPELSDGFVVTGKTGTPGSCVKARKNVTRYELDHWTRLNHTVLYCLNESLVDAK